MLYPIAAMAEIDCIQITLPSGENQTIMLTSKPKLIMDSLQITVRYDESEISIPLENGLKVKQSDSKLTAVHNTASQLVSFSISEHAIMSHGLAPDEQVSLVNDQGVIIHSVQADANGNASISLPDKGLFVIKSKEKSFKFVIK